MSIKFYQGDDVGKIIDNRSAKNCPSYQNLRKKSSEELRDLLIKVHSFVISFILLIF